MGKIGHCSGAVSPHQRVSPDQIECPLKTGFTVHFILEMFNVDILRHSIALHA